MRRFIVFVKNLFSIPYRICFTKTAITAILQSSIVDKKAAICGATRFYRSSIDKYSYIGKDCFVESTIIGCYTSVASNCYIGSASHPIDWVSTSPVFHKQRNVMHKNFAMHDYQATTVTRIGNDVWIGEGCKIKAGVTIGDGAIVGMGSVVTKNIEPYAIYAGNPARCIRKRFDEEMIQDLLRIKWWDWDEDRIRQFGASFNNSLEFLRKVKET